MARERRVRADHRVRVERPSEDVLCLWLDRPEKRNAIDDCMVSEVMRALRSCAARAVVLGSSDRRCFCGGADLSLSDRERANVSDRLYELYEHMVRLPAPIIAAIEGPAVGGGAQLAVAADLRIASANASLRFVGPGHGLAIGAWALPGLVGRGRAVDLSLTMRPIGAAEALEAGLVNRVDDDPKRAALEMAAGFAELDEGAVRRVKAVAHRATGTLGALADERRRNRTAWSGSVGAHRTPERRPSNRPRSASDI
jgi:enoyl-CoA hydratase